LTTPTAPIFLEDLYISQARRNLDVARSLATSGAEWACVVSQQAAELAMKSLLLALGHHADRLKAQGAGHGLKQIWENFLMCSLDFAVADLKLLEDAYIPARYPAGTDTPQAIFAARNVTDFLAAADRIVVAAEKILPNLRAIRGALSAPAPPPSP
jgi:HEPN domain-containing protein